MKIFTKDPSDVLDYTRKAAKFLGTDTISTSTWSADSGITIDSDSNDTSTATVWLSGGTAGNQYTITNRIVTSGGRTKDKSFIVKVEQQ